MPDSVRVLGAVRVIARYRAPQGDGELLAIPPLAEIDDQLAANASKLNSSRIQLAGIPLSEFRQRAIAEVIEASRTYLTEATEPVPPAGTRLFCAGHQPEFYHPGVWVKNFVLHSLSRRLGYSPLNLIVDNDTVRGTDIRLPVVSENPEAVSTADIPFDRSGIDLPYEEYCVQDRSLFESLPTRLEAATQNWGFKPIAHAIWSNVNEHSQGGATFGESVSRVRRRLEREWGVVNFELPVSRLAATRAFAGFVHTILSDLPHHLDCYNAAIHAYREANGLRSKNHPAPDLASEKERLEAPFWAWRHGTRRERLYVSPSDGQLFAGKTPLCRLPTNPNDFLTHCSGKIGGWQIRPRALTLTLFVRLAFADGFIHGIGGGKYDEVTDDIIRRAFGIEPPGYSVVSATLRLPISRFPATEQTLHNTERRVRDLEWNPQQFAATKDQLPNLVRAKSELIASEPQARPERRAWFRKLQELTRELRPPLVGELEHTSRTLEQMRSELAANGILASREYSWLLFPEQMLRDFFSRCAAS